MTSQGKRGYQVISIGIQMIKITKQIRSEVNEMCIYNIRTLFLYIKLNKTSLGKLILLENKKAKFLVSKRII